MIEYSRKSKNSRPFSEVDKLVKAPPIIAESPAGYIIIMKDND